MEHCWDVQSRQVGVSVGDGQVSSLRLSRSEAANAVVEELAVAVGGSGLCDGAIGAWSCGGKGAARTRAGNSTLGSGRVAEDSGQLNSDRSKHAGRWSPSRVTRGEARLVREIDPDWNGLWGSCVWHGVIQLGYTGG